MSAIFDTLLKDLTTSNYDTLIEQEKMRADGWTFHYAIDADLIAIYCFPKGIGNNSARIKKRNLTEEYLADEQITIHALLNLNKGDERIIFLDEYSKELEKMIRTASAEARINSDKREEIEVFNKEQLKKLKGDFYEDGFDRDWFERTIREDYSKIIASVLQNTSGLEKIKKVFDENLLLFDSSEFEDPLLTNAFDIERGSDEKTDSIIQLFGSYKNESKRIDAKVIDRILSINEFIQIWGENPKHVIVNAIDDNTSSNVYKHLENRPDYPYINGKKISLYRTISELFAYLISLTWTDKGEIDSQKTIQNLVALRDANQQISSGKIAEEESKKNAILFDRYKELRNNFENIGIYEFHKQHFEKLLADSNSRLNDFRQFINKLQNHEHKLFKDTNKIRNWLLEKMSREVQINRHILHGLAEIENQKGQFNISKGNDPIEGSYQHLPLFFNFKHTDYQNIGELLIQMVLEKKPYYDSFIDEFGKIFEKLSEILDNSIYPIEEQIIRAFTYIILPKSNESDAYDYLINSNHKQNKTDSIEWLYAICWISRRSNRYDEAIRYANEGIEKTNNKDPRFLHGRFLANYCKYEENPNIRLLNSIIQDAIESFQLYPNFLSLQYNGNLFKDIKTKIDYTFYNCLCFFYVEKAKLIKQQNPDDAKRLIVSARQDYLSKLKDANKQYHEALPEYYDTEANLEYIESFLLEDKLTRIQCADNAIKKAIKLSFHTTLQNKYKNTQQQIQEREILLKSNK